MEGRENFGKNYRRRTLKLNTENVKSLRMEETKFYAAGMKIELMELTNAICAAYFN